MPKYKKLIEIPNFTHDEIFSVKYDNQKISLILKIDELELYNDDEVILSLKYKIIPQWEVIGNKINIYFENREQHITLLGTPKIIKKISLSMNNRCQNLQTFS